MTQMPPPQPVSYAPPRPTPTNAMAIVSLICGVVGCLFITPIIGIITGIIGVKNAKPPVGGKGMAITGIILSLLWIVGLVGGSIAAYSGVKYAIQLVESQTKQPAIAFINQLVDGDLASAQSASNFSEEQLKGLSDGFKEFGKCTDIDINAPSYDFKNGVTTLKFAGTAQFEKAGGKQIDATFIDDGKGSGLKLNEITVK